MEDALDDQRGCLGMDPERDDAGERDAGVLALESLADAFHVLEEPGEREARGLRATEDAGGDPAEPKLHAPGRARLPGPRDRSDVPVPRCGQERQRRCRVRANRGTEPSAVTRGVVVEVCERCAAVRSCLVVDHLRVWHFCGTSVGDPTFQGSTRACATCQQHYDHDDGTYSDVLPIGDLELLSLEEGIRRINPRLSALLDVVARARQLAAGPAYRAAGLDETRHLVESAADCFERLVYRGGDATRFAERLDHWARLSDPERAELASALEAELPKER